MIVKVKMENDVCMSVLYKPVLRKLHFELTDFISCAKSVIWFHFSVLSYLGLHLMMIINMFVLYIFGIKCSFMFIDVAFMCFMESESD